MRRLAPPRDEPWASPLLATDALRRPRSASASPPREGVRRFLSETDEQEVLGVLREQFRHEQRITTDDVRFVVRALASHGGAATIPADFPPARWILEFKRAHGFALLSGSGSSFPFGLPDRINVNRRSNSIARVAASSVSSGGSSDDERDSNERTLSRYAGEPGYSRFGSRPDYDGGSPLQHARLQQQQRQQHQRRSVVVDERRAAALWAQREHTGDRKELGSSTSSGSFDSENGVTTGASSSSSVSTSLAPPPSTTDSNRSNYDSSQDSASSEKRGYKLSHTVPPETWEKAIAAVELQGMSLRAAAKIYGVHFAALHRRVKKRAQGGQSSKGNNGYFHPSDEAGIMRVVVARAELGVLMTFDELMKLVETAALRKLPDISVENARKLMMRFQTRNEQSIRHTIDDWPPPLPSLSSGTSASHYHLEHPGFNYAGESVPSASMQRSLPTCAVGSTATAAAVAAAPPPLFVPPARVDSYSSLVSGDDNNNSRPVLPSMNLNRSPLRPTDTTMASPQLQLQRVSRDQDSSRSRPVMFV
ncbi:hypothetical protein PF003_g8548 [Phytophthora fragariae]|nr:hypothetical protein PF003_g8548 [Phytophthora fragariae]